MKVSLVEATESEPISLEAMKAWLKLEIDDDDDLIEALIVAARQHCEQELNKSLVAQTFLVKFDGFSNVLELPFPPVSTVDEVLYYDANGVQQELSSASYWFSGGLPSRIESKTSFPATQNRLDAVSVEYTTSGEATESVKTAMKMLIAHWYENRSAVETGTIATEIPLAVKTILQNERNWRL